MSTSLIPSLHVKIVVIYFSLLDTAWCLSLSDTAWIVSLALWCLSFSDTAWIVSLALWWLALSSSWSFAQMGEVAWHYYPLSWWAVELPTCLDQQKWRLISCVMRERRLMVTSRSARPECSLVLRPILRVFLFRNLSTLSMQTLNLKKRKEIYIG